MTRNPEAAQGEAIQSLAARLDSWGVEEPLAKAAEFVHDMVREGWRPRGPRCEVPEPIDPRRDRKPDEVPEYLAAKAALRGGGAS